jgi:hypothetical protein
VAEISDDFILKTIVGHFLSDSEALLRSADRGAYMTTQSPGRNGCIADRVMVSHYGSFPFRGNFRLGAENLSE